MKVLGIGDNVVDTYLDQKMMYPGGNALNFSVYAKKLGVKAAYLGVFGSDQAAQHIQQTLQSLRIDLSQCRQYEGENGYALVDLVEGDRVFIGGNQGGVQQEHPIQLDTRDIAYIQTFDLAHSSIYSGMEQEIYKLKEAGILVSFDFSNEFDEAILESVCKHVDYSLLSCGEQTEEEVKEWLVKVHRYGSRLGIGTMGSRGALLYDGHRFYKQAPHYVQPVDTMGAGDSFFTAFILHYVQEKSLGSKGDEAVLLTASLEAGARYASKTCLVEGAFGYGISF